MEYASRFSQDVRQKLESLKATIDRDLGTLDTYVGNLTFSQADEILLDASSVLDSYRTFMGHLYRGAGKPSYAARRSGGTRANSRGKMEPAALETMQGQGYLVDKEFVARYGFNQNAVARKLQELAATYNWRREKTDTGWKYTPVAVAPPAGPSAPAGEQGEQATASSGETPLVEQTAATEATGPSPADQQTSPETRKARQKSKSRQEKTPS